MLLVRMEFRWSFGFVLSARMSYQALFYPESPMAPSLAPKNQSTFFHQNNWTKSIVQVAMITFSTPLQSEALLFDIIHL